ncbi:MAG: PDZ domain-containing protein [Candidatus Riflebacteria bacterium]|nr:PDZ domain-containing protein [Candidatus Riflebacteria bacterium]
MNPAGYYRHPTIHGDTVVFVCEEDLWAVSAHGGIARRLTAGPAPASAPAFSPDGKLIAYAGSDEGCIEVYVMPADGGESRRLTWLGCSTTVCGWTSDGRIVFSSNTGQPFPHLMNLYAISPDGGSPDPLPAGIAVSVSFGPHGAMVIGRHALDPARWKRYHGGTAGDLWIDPAGKGAFKRLISLPGNLVLPMWISDRIFFVSDHEGVANIYSCTPTGADLKRHTHHQDFFVRFPSAYAGNAQQAKKRGRSKIESQLQRFLNGSENDKASIVYQAGADLFRFDVAANRSERLDFALHSPRAQLHRKFVDSSRHLEDAMFHPKSHLLTLITRGKCFTMGNWEGPVRRHGSPDGVRYRLTRWLNDGKRLVMVSDAEGVEALEIRHDDEFSPPKRLVGLDIGRPLDLKVSPKADRVVLTNHRNELLHVDLESGKAKLLDASTYAAIGGFDWSPDGRWIAYSRSESRHTSIIRVCLVETGESYPVTRPVLQDIAPAFDPDGKYLYFLSLREFDPVYDGLHFDLGFPKGVRPYLVTLRRDLPSPFVPVPKPSEDPASKNDHVQKPLKENDAKGDSQAALKKSGSKSASQEVPKDAPKDGVRESLIEIDVAGIEDRVLAFPVPDGRYQKIMGIRGKVLFTSVPVEGSLSPNSRGTSEPPARAVLEMFDFETRKSEPMISGISTFSLSLDRKLALIRIGNRLRVVKAGEKSDENAAKEPPGRKSGWIDLSRIRVSIDPRSEWRQMFREAWRLQRDNFWTEDLSGVDWHGVYKRYLPLLERVSTRVEFSDLLWEMQGELGTSHAYEFGGDYRASPSYGIGLLGADIAFDRKKKTWKIARIVRGDSWNEQASSPLARPGLCIEEGCAIISVDGLQVGEDVSPAELLVNRARCEVALTVMADAGKKKASPGGDSGKTPRTVVVKPIASEFGVRYREWVETNRRIVHEKTAGRVGYVHIPNMGPLGYSEFHRYFLAEIDREGLIVDVRFNGGGHVSQLILEKLARRRIAYTQSRWFGVEPYPGDSVAGPIVALTNQFAGSDGDIFSHCFKIMKLGPLIGTRTWGGVVGIWVRYPLVDGGTTSQPEFSFWFQDVGWKVENYGTDPDIEVEIRPQDYVAGCDPQLAQGISEIERLFKVHPPEIPDLGKRPNLSTPHFSPHRERPIRKDSHAKLHPKAR